MSVLRVDASAVARSLRLRVIVIVEDGEEGALLAVGHCVTDGCGVDCGRTLSGRFELV